MKEKELWEVKYQLKNSRNFQLFGKYDSLEQASDKIRLIAKLYVGMLKAVKITKLL